MRGPGETSVESNSTVENESNSQDCTSEGHQRDPCASPPCKRLKQAQLSFTSPVSPKTSQNGTFSSACSSIPTSPCHTTPIGKSAQSTLDGHRTVTGTGGLVTGAPSPQDQNKITPIYQEGQPIAPQQLEESPDVPQANPSSAQSQVSDNQMSPSQSQVPSNQSSPSQGFTRTPGNSMKSTEKQKRQEEKENQRLERQKLKEDKDKQLLEAKAMKEQERLQAKQRKGEERQEKRLEKEKKEKERLEKKQKEEQERQERNKKKDEEKKKKEEEKNAKLEEKRKREEDKKQQEEEQLRKKQKVQQNFASFFCKESAPVPKMKPCNSLSRFQPFEIKQCMILAPGYRKKLTEEMKETVDKGLLTQDKTMLYLQELTERKTASDLSKKDRNVDEMQCELLNQDENSNLSVEIIEKKETRVVVKAKLFQFHTNNRPPYFGSWRKKSQLITPRNPFKQDTKTLDYEVDSDDEWEEEEPGESLSNSEGEDEDEAGDEEDKDGFFVPHGYLSDDEGVEDEDKCSDPDAKKEQQLTKVKQWEAELKRKCKPLKPVCIGCLWFGDAELNATLRQFEACVLTDSLGIETTNNYCAASTEKSYHPASDSSPAHYSKTMYVPEEAMPDLVKLLHLNTAGLVKLINHFRRFWTAKFQKKENVTDAEVEERCPISKRQLERKIQAIATKERRGDRPRWYVHPGVLSSYSMESSLGMESSLDKENEDRLSPLNASLQGLTTISKFVVPMPKSKSLVSCSPLESLTTIAKSPNNVEMQENAKSASGSNVGVEITKLLLSATTGAQKGVGRIGSVSVEKDQAFIANAKQMPSGNAVDDTPEPMELDSSPGVESTTEALGVESRTEALGVKPLSLIAKLNKGNMDHSAEMQSMLRASPLVNKQSCSSHEVICID